MCLTGLGFGSLRLEGSNFGHQVGKLAKSRGLQASASLIQ